MDYLALARKYRPDRFTSLVGQTHVVSALTHALAQQRLHHAYLFTGTRGVGKTTLARILASCLNCEKGITPEPCGKCTSCREIQEGRFVDLIEVDAATNTGVNEMRQLLESAVYAPTRGRYKVYVVDEVHMLSTSAFNAMLKTLEEPPPHLKFILATTDPQKIPVTVLSRCLQFNLKPLSVSVISEQLAHVASQEKVPFDNGALLLLAKAARGSMRDALSLLDQAIAHGAGTLNERAVRDMLGMVEADYLYRILDALAVNDVSAVLREAELIEQKGLSPEMVLNELAQILTKVSMMQLAPDVLMESDPDRSALSALSVAFHPETLQLYYQICIYGRRDMAWAPDAYSGFLMTLMRMSSFHPDMLGKSDCPSPPSTATMRHEAAGEKKQTERTASGRFSLRGQKAAVSSQRCLSGQAAISAVQQPTTFSSVMRSVSHSAISSEANCSPVNSDIAENRSVMAPTSGEVVQCAPDAAEDREMVLEQVKESVSKGMEGKEPAVGADTAFSLLGKAIDWHECVEQMRLSGPAKLLAEHCEIAHCDTNGLTLRLPRSHEKRKTPLAAGKLEQALRQLLATPDFRLSFEIGDIEKPTYAMVKAQARQAVHDATVAAIQTDPQVRKIVDLFEAVVDMDSIHPIQE